MHLNMFDKYILSLLGILYDLSEIIRIFQVTISFKSSYEILLKNFIMQVKYFK